MFEEILEVGEYVNGKGDVEVKDEEINGGEFSDGKAGSKYDCEGW